VWFGVVWFGLVWFGLVWFGFPIISLVSVLILVVVVVVIIIFIKRMQYVFFVKNSTRVMKVGLHGT